MKTKELVIIALAAFLIVVSAQLKLQIYVVPFSMQFMMIQLLSLVLPPKLSFSSILLYILLGLMGFPVFAGGGGIMYILKPGFGFLLAFLAIPLVSQWSTNRKGRKFISFILTGVLSWICLYGLALPYCYIIVKYVFELNITLLSFLITFCLVFLPSDILAIGISLLIADRMQKHQVFRSL